ncbi:hypothetical protein SNEBB_007775 [Seison nebaliae]|nr:hypothetical protein SNEBB_007775 [Seison nebaliae]
MLTSTEIFTLFCLTFAFCNCKIIDSHYKQPDSFHFDNGTHAIDIEQGNVKIKVPKFRFTINYETFQDVVSEYLRYSRELRSNHWCCKDSSYESSHKSLSKITSFKGVEHHKVKSDSVGCGVFGVKTCSTYTIIYSEKVMYKIETEIYKDIASCPPKYLSCCEGYLAFKSNCIHGNTILNNNDLLLQLHSLGLLDRK